MFGDRHQEGGAGIMGPGHEVSFEDARNVPYSDLGDVYIWRKSPNSTFKIYAKIYLLMYAVMHIIMQFFRRSKGKKHGSLLSACYVAGKVLST